jgi:hypothetical protein
MKEIMLLHHFTWMQYLGTLTVLLVIYYAVVLFKCYLPEVQEKLSGDKPFLTAPLSALQYEKPVATEEAFEDPLVMQTEQLISSLKSFIATAPSQPAGVATGIKEIFNEYAMIKDTQLRPAINELVVTECEKNGAALLTEAEVNEWWEALAGGATL